MRRIYKSAQVPSTLVSAPVPQNAADVCAKYYKADDVRLQLVKDQFCKCAYCECSLTLAYNDVEHYRPKSVYYWLGHDWSNLLYSCNSCNRTFKNDAFPLKDDAKRATSPVGVIAEEPLLVNPSTTEPSDHIGFRRHIAVALTEEGQTTIDVFHLNDSQKRKELMDERERLYQRFEQELKKLNLAKECLLRPGLSQDIVDYMKQMIRICEDSIAVMKSPSQAYSGMLIAQI